jgi:hydroxyethylthiazole kinase-like uncharacterized protein yjeF
VTPLDASWLRDHPLPRPGEGGKDERGAVLVVGGQQDLIGAVLLAGTAALRAGAGKLQLAADAQAVAALATAVPEARVLALAADATDPVAIGEDLKRHAANCDALLIGPGMLSDDAGRAGALLALETGQALILDAGALQAVAGHRAKSQGRPLILTPHAGEMAHLLGTEKSEIVADPLRAAQAACELFGATVVMKGATTLVVSPDAPPLRYAGGGPGLGTSGSGDVLAGLLAGFVARGAAPMPAAAWAVFVHGEAGARLASRLGPVGFLAREISAEAPAILAAFG